MDPAASPKYLSLQPAHATAQGICRRHTPRSPDWTTPCRIHQDLPTRPLRVGLIRVLCLVRNGAEVGVGGWVGSTQGTQGWHNRLKGLVKSSGHCSDLSRPVPIAKVHKLCLATFQRIDQLDHHDVGVAARKAIHGAVIHDDGGSSFCEGADRFYGTAWKRCRDSSMSMVTRHVVEPVSPLQLEAQTILLTFPTT
eukprot:CAMPEP_0175915558 /NCGR_PEP_ID=MMETSP0108-20121206/10381_1 /TAXON_ID=195067 ORGANISM="Goniomonas pacifica, Strain CCMP1869" /NCGR_SAMPLE_ID=MMETSP0108 /ASSEMBLY_ACC=CAM_ASM_000204 /LENGTH=194 /DNA_ID=CAMNT_0017238059 /DNA_START=244 /DNA_END=828 /DNA_ORIENTATION=-